MNLNPIREKTGPPRLRDMVPDRSKQAFKTWLSARPKAWRDLLAVVAMDGFAALKTAASQETPDAAAAIDPSRRPHFGAFQYSFSVASLTVSSEVGFRVVGLVALGATRIGTRRGRSYCFRGYVVRCRPVCSFSLPPRLKPEPHPPTSDG